MMISNEEKIYRKLLEVYPSSLATITELSFNCDASANFVESNVKGFNFDTVENCHPDCCNKEKSPDSLFYTNSKLYFIEFKEGKSKKDDIRLKIHEAVSTLYSFCKVHTPEITREDFFKLDIRYAVVLRAPDKHPNSSFAYALDLNSQKYHLKNLDGYIIKKTRIATHPKSILNVLKTATENAVTSISIHNHFGEPIHNVAA
ncbi:hypothetical protein [Enterovibrio coralii]|uniref:Uncharacterized protein n=1 Tax=Enterovibrio coralii TaxID=294935 RepID=A0A135I4H6_9GAMM|nr:hypothetical protein [Enterovibrio coralii]KXF80327.1 hypothetical protein ATN88_10935 [Enterovibrio coralii]